MVWVDTFVLGDAAWRDKRTSVIEFVSTTRSARYGIAESIELHRHEVDLGVKAAANAAALGLPLHCRQSVW